MRRLLSTLSVGYLVATTFAVAEPLGGSPQDREIAGVINLKPLKEPAELTRRMPDLAYLPHSPALPEYLSTAGRAEFMPVVIHKGHERILAWEFDTVSEKLGLTPGAAEHIYNSMVEISCDDDSIGSGNFANLGPGPTCDKPVLITSAHVIKDEKNDWKARNKCTAVTTHHDEIPLTVDGYNIRGQYWPGEGSPFRSSEDIFGFVLDPEYVSVLVGVQCIPLSNFQEISKNCSSDGKSRRDKSWLNVGYSEYLPTIGGACGEMVPLVGQDFAKILPTDCGIKGGMSGGAVMRRCGSEIPHMFAINDSDSSKFRDENDDPIDGLEYSAHLNANYVQLIIPKFKRELKRLFSKEFGVD